MTATPQLPTDDIIACMINAAESRLGNPAYKRCEVESFIEGLRYTAYLMTYGNEAEQWEAARKELSQLVKRQNA